MHIHKKVRLFLTGLLLASISFSSLALSPVQADTSSSVTLSPAITAKLDAFIVKVQARRSKYSSDENYNIFLDTLGSKIIALKQRYGESPLILAVLDQLSLKVKGIKTQGNAIEIANNGIVYAQVSNPQTGIIIEGLRAGTMDGLPGGTNTYSNMATIVQQATSNFINNLNAAEAANNETTRSTVESFIQCIKINGDVVYGTNAAPSGTKICPNYISPNYKSATFTPIVSAPLLGQPLDSANVSKLTVSPAYNNGQAVRLLSNRGQSRSFQFTTGDVGEIGRWVTEETPLGNKPMLFMNISTVPNDFRYDNLDDGHNFGCASSQVVYRTVNPTDPGVMACRLKPHTTYYLNIRNEDATLGTRNGNSRGKDSAVYDSNAYLLQVHFYQADDKTTCSNVGDICSNPQLKLETEYAK